MSYTVTDEQLQNLSPTELSFRKKVIQQFIDAAARILDKVPEVENWNEMRHLLGVNLKAMNDAADALNVRAALRQCPPDEPEAIIPPCEIKAIALV